MSGVSGWRIAESVVTTPLRVALGGMFVFAAFTKLNEAGDVQALALSIRGYGLIDDPHAIRTLAFTLPFAELLAGLGLILGAWTRGSAMLTAMMLAVFTYAYVNIFYIQGIRDKECSCFGETEVFCSGPIGECHIIRNAVLGAAALLLSWRGGGLLSVDRWLGGIREGLESGRDVEEFAEER